MRSGTPEAKNTIGAAMLWLDGFYAARAGISDYPAGWSQILAQAVGGTCAVSVNASRPVLDVIADVHRQYGNATAVH